MSKGRAKTGCKRRKTAGSHDVAVYVDASAASTPSSECDEQAKNMRMVRGTNVIVHMDYFRRDLCLSYVTDVSIASHKGILALCHVQIWPRDFNLDSKYV